MTMPATIGSAKAAATRTIICRRRLTRSGDFAFRSCLSSPRLDVMPSRLASRIRSRAVLSLIR